MTSSQYTVLIRKIKDISSRGFGLQSSTIPASLSRQESYPPLSVSDSHFCRTFSSFFPTSKVKQSPPKKQHHSPRFTYAYTTVRQRAKTPVVTGDQNSSIPGRPSRFQMGQRFGRSVDALASALRNFSSPHALPYNKWKPETKLDSFPTQCMREALEEAGDRGENRFQRAEGNQASLADRQAR